MPEIKSIDISEKLPPVGSVRFLRAEWKTPGARFVLVWYAINGREQPLALRLDLDKQVFLDDLPPLPDAGYRVGAVVSYIVSEVAAYRRALREAIKAEAY